jgi:adenylyltransferase/sulfurtransferase
MTEFSQEEILRYPRHFSVDAIGIEGQKKIKAARVLLIGAGGVGSPSGIYLTASGIGHLGIIDHDVVEMSNLQRQILFRTEDIGKLKVDVAKNQLNQLNPFTEIQIYPYALSPENAADIFLQYDYILDGSDNYPTRYLVNRACQQTKKKLISASVFQFGGQIACFSPGESPCYECLYPSAPPPELIPNCTQSGVLGVTPGIIALFATNQILIHILGLSFSNSFFGKIHEFNGLNLSIRTYDIPVNTECPACSSNQKPHSLQASQSQKISNNFFEKLTLNPSNPSNHSNLFNPMDACKMNQKNSFSDDLYSDTAISPVQLKTYLESKESFQLIDVREPWEREISKIAPSLSIPLGNLVSQLKAAHHDSEKLPTLDPETLTITYCQAGVRSAKAAQILKEIGFKKVLNLSGGMDAWTSLANQNFHTT